MGEGEEITRRASEAERRESSPVSFVVEGGIPLEGTVYLQGAKNAALQAIAASILTDDRIILENFPRIGDTDINLSILIKLGAEVEQRPQGITSITTGDISTSKTIDPNDSLRTTGSRYFIPTLVRRVGSVTAGPPGGDQIGAPNRFLFRREDLEMFERVGIGNRQIVDSQGRPSHEFFPLTEDKPRILRLERRYFGPTVQALLSYAGTDEEFTVVNPSLEPEVKDTIALLNSMGADIEYQRPDSLHIKGSRYLHGTRHRIISDPNAMVSYAAMALITNGEVIIKGIDHTSKTDAFMRLLMAMNADFYFGGGILQVNPDGRLQPVDLKTDFWPAQCHTDWQQILTPVLATTNGTSYVDENVYPSRFTGVERLRNMGANLTLISDPTRISREEYKTDRKSHTLRINGPVDFHSAPVIIAPPDIRGATGILLALLAAKGRSRLNNAQQVLRGIEDVDVVIKSLGGRIHRA